VIVSASYRTDIPAFYGDWFARRLAAGFCTVKNPYGSAPYRVALRGSDVDGFVFWTRNARPFLPVLDDLAEQGTPFVVQYTITGYPAAIDAATPPTAHAVATARDVATRYGVDTLVWRYDPILLSAATPLESHMQAFDPLAAALAGACNEVVVSFAHFYRKSVRRLDAATPPLSWRDPTEPEKAALLHTLNASAQAHGMRLTLCTQPDLVDVVPGVGAARCIDDARLSRIAGRTVGAREKGNRPGCRCAETRNIGTYDTCAHGCLYCYAVRNPDAAQRAVAGHDPRGATL
jgi:nucleotide-binding universal stress UspA family protein